MTKKSRYHTPFFLTDEERMVMGAINMGHLVSILRQDAVHKWHDYNVGGINVTDAVFRLAMWGLIEAVSGPHWRLTPEGVWAL